MRHFSIAGTTLVKQEKESSKLRLAGGAWSINLDELPELVDRFEYITEKGRYSIDRDDAFMDGFIRYMNGEKKLIVPIKYWNFS